MKFIKQFIHLLILLVIIATTVEAQEIKNYCHDQAVWAEWDKQLEKAQGHSDFKALYALRTGLCTMIERKQISINEAAKIFEKAREDLIEEKEKERKRKRFSF